MPEINLSKYKKWAPSRLSAPEDFVYPRNWLKQLGETVTTLLGFSGIQKTDFFREFNAKTGPASGYKWKENLIATLKDIYPAIIDERIPLNHRVEWASKLNDGVPDCPEGFHNRVNEIKIALAPIENLDDLLGVRRREIIDKVAVKLIALSKVSEGNHIHAQNECFVMAESMGFGRLAINATDKYRSGTELPPFIIEGTLKKTFEKEYTLFNTLNYVKQYLNREVGPENSLGYVGRKEGEDYYEFSDFQKFTTILQRIFKVPESELFVMNDEGHIIDINWSDLLPSLLRTFRTEEYFKLSAAEGVLFDSLTEPLSIEDFRARIETFSETTLFSNTDELMHCLGFLSDWPADKKCLVIQRYLKNKTPDVHREVLDRLHDQMPDLIPELVQITPDTMPLYFYLAALEGNLANAQKWAAQHGISKDSNIDINIAFYLAVESGKAALVRYLLSEGANVEHLSPNGNTGLMIASHEGHIEVVDVLLEAGAEVNKINKQGISAFLLAVDNGHIEVVNRLIAAKADVACEVTGCNALHIAANKGYTALAKILLDQHIPLNKADNTGHTALMIAALKGHGETVEMLLNEGADVSLLNHDGYSTLRCAVMNGNHHAIVDALLHRGADPNQGRYSPLYVAAFKDYKECVVLLLAHNAQINKGEINLSPIYAAVEQGHVGVVNMLLHHPGLDATTDGNVLMGLALTKGHLEVVELLASQKVLPINLDNALIEAVKCQVPLKLIEALIRAHADINAIEDDGEKNSALYYAAFWGNLEIVKLLIREGAAINTVNSNQFSPCYAAVRGGHKSIVTEFLDAGVDVNTTEPLNTSFLFVAACKNHCDVVKLLLEWGADVELGNGTNAPLSAAIFYNNFKVAELLIAHGASLSTDNPEDTSIVALIDKFYNLAREDGDARKSILQLLSTVPPAIREEFAFDTFTDIQIGLKLLTLSKSLDSLNLAESTAPILIQMAHVLHREEFPPHQMYTTLVKCILDVNLADDSPARVDHRKHQDLVIVLKKCCKGDDPLKVLEKIQHYVNHLNPPDAALNAGLT